MTTLMLNDLGPEMTIERPYERRPSVSIDQSLREFQEAAAMPKEPTNLSDFTRREEEPELSKYEMLGKAIGTLVTQKQVAYGDSFGKAGEAFRLLYPNGISPSKMDDALCLVRIWDKMMRIATDKGALGENPYQDIAGYALLGAFIGEGK